MPTGNSVIISQSPDNHVICRKGILRAGDRILQINGIDMRGASRSEADQLLVPSVDGLCTLQIEYDIPVHGEFLFVTVATFVVAWLLW